MHDIKKSRRGGCGGLRFSSKGQLRRFDSVEGYRSGAPGWVDRDGCYGSKVAPATFLICGDWLEPPGRPWRRDLPCFGGGRKKE